MFQSRTGFSGRRDTDAVFRPERLTDCFNPVLGFLAVATTSGRNCRAKWPVSIPYWVFWPSRPGFDSTRASLAHGFNPVLGFLAVATELFIRYLRTGVEFQSRTGFSGRRDRAKDAYQKGKLCFNPVLGFLAVATTQTDSVLAMAGEFQSRTGFSGRRDRNRADEQDCPREFQSRTGFSGRRDV